MTQGCISYICSDFDWSASSRGENQHLDAFGNLDYALDNEIRKGSTRCGTVGLKIIRSPKLGWQQKLPQSAVSTPWFCSIFHSQKTVDLGCGGLYISLHPCEVRNPLNLIAGFQPPTQRSNHEIHQSTMGSFSILARCASIQAQASV